MIKYILITSILFILGVLAGTYIVAPNMAVDRLFEFNRAKLNDLHTTHMWSHDSSDATWDERVEGYELKQYLGEVLYMGSSCDARIAFDLWDKSPTHKEVLDHEYKAGIMTVYKANNICYIVFNVENF